jgi:hypothetical protein
MISRLILLFGLLLICSLILQVFTLFVGVILCLVLSLLWLWLNLFPDKWLLHYLQAREIIENDHPLAYRLARAQAHKFKIHSLKIYSYNGFFHRVFALSSQKRLAFVIEKEILNSASREELESLFFSLALNANQGIAKKHTLSLLVTSLLWVGPLNLFPRNLNKLNWFIQYTISPIDSALQAIIMPQFRWRRFLKKLSFYQWENQRLVELNFKLDQPKLKSSISRFATYRFFAAHHTSSQQMILALEGAHHPFDMLGSVN